MVFQPEQDNGNMDFGFATGRMVVFRVNQHDDYDSHSFNFRKNAKTFKQLTTLFSISEVLWQKI